LAAHSLPHKHIVSRSHKATPNGVRLIGGTKQLIL
jgi:hypothetical protein